MNKIQTVKDIINDWASDDDVDSPSVPVKTYQNKKLFSLTKQNHLDVINNRNAKIKTDKLNMILNCKENDNYKRKSISIEAIAEGRILGCLVCSVCEFKTNIPTFMKAHMRKHSRKKNVICDKCFRRFDRGKDFVNHVKKVHRRVEYKCSICEFRTNEQSTLRRHIVLHKDIKLIQISVEKNINQLNFDCTVCGYKFDNKPLLKKHMKLHDGSIPFICPVCKNHFKEPTDMIRINDTENGQWQFQCRCQCKFTLKNPIRGKLVLSEGERPFQCGICSCKFRHPHVLSTHMKCHLERSAYKCNLCSNSFRLMAHLESHMRSHRFHSSLGIKGEP